MGEAETQVDSTDSQERSAQAEKGGKQAENIRYGQNISESGMGGKTTTSSGQANSEGAQSAPSQTEGGADSSDAKQSRSAQGYGSGSGVGA